MAIQTSGTVDPQDPTPDADKALGQGLSPSQANTLKEIFRTDAVGHLRRTTGSPIRPVGFGVLGMTIFIALLLLAVGIFLVTATYARKETVLGQITPTDGAFRITAQLNGIADRVLVREGQKVKAGDELIVVSADPVLKNGETLVDSLKSIQTTQRRSQELQAKARSEQLDRQREELFAKRDGIQFDIDRLIDSRKLLERRKALQAQTVDAHRKLAKQGMVSAAAVRQQEDVLLGLQQQVQQAARETGLQRSQLAQVRAQIGRVRAEADFAKSEESSDKALLHERELNFEALHSGRLSAPIDGVVTALRVRSGSTVSPGQTLAVIVPNLVSSSKGQLEIELWAPSKSVGFVRPGAKVRIMYDAFPYQTFGVGHGIVRDVSGTPLSPAELSVPIESREQLFRIRVSLADTNLIAYGREWPLVPGMRLTADLILEEQSLLDWVLGPLRAVNKRAI